VQTPLEVWGKRKNKGETSYFEYEKKKEEFHQEAEKGVTDP